MSSSEPPIVLSYRHVLTGAVEGFLAEQDMACPHTAEALADLVASLASYREEGTWLFPAVFICDDLAAFLSHVRGCDVLRLGSGPRSQETMRRALKACGPLGTGGFCVFVERRGPTFEYGVFRTDGFVLNASAMEVLRTTADPRLRAVGVVQLAENILELRGSLGITRYVYLSGARPDTAPPPVVLGELVRAITRDVDPTLAADLRRFYRHVFIDALRASHGALVVVIPPDAQLSSLFVDGILLDPLIDVPQRVAAYRATHAEDARAAVHALSHLLEGMLRTDGITVLRSDGVIVGYNVFIQHRRPAAGQAGIGGARRRTFDVLCTAVGRELVAAFYRSQDGESACRSAAG